MKLRLRFPSKEDRHKFFYLLPYGVNPKSAFRLQHKKSGKFLFVGKVIKLTSKNHATKYESLERSYADKPPYGFRWV